MKDLPVNLSKFRKIHSDDATTTFRHYEGHEIKVAHGKLSKSMREKLDKLPHSKPKESKSEEPVMMASGGVMPPGPCQNPDCHSYGKRHPNCRCYSYAEGGTVKHKDSCPFSVCERFAEGGTTKKKDEKKDLEIESVDPAGTPPLQVDAVDPTSPEAQAPARQLAGSAVPQDVSASAQPVAPVQNFVGPPKPHTLSSSIATTPGPDPHYVNTKTTFTTRDHLNAEDSAFQNDLKNGHITPKTYESLFAERGTLGRIGTLFGLLVSGAGSGLSHQPNAVLGMMQKEIENDLEAQKQSKINAQNFLKINQAGLLNDAQIKKLQQEGKLTEEQARAVRTEANMKAYTLANMQMNRAVLHSLTDKMNMLPPGSPQRQQMEQVIRALFESVNNENFNLADRAQAASSIFGAFPASSGPGQPGTASGGGAHDKPNALGYTPLLHRGAEAAFQGLQYTPKAKEQMGEITKQFTAAQQADKLMPLILQSFDNATKLRSWTARVNEELNPHALAGVGGAIGAGLGAGAGGAGAIPGGAIGATLGEGAGYLAQKLTNTDSVRAYEAEKTKLTGFIARALGNTNLGSEEIAKIVKGMVPVAGDSDSTIAEKRRGLIDKIQKIETSLLKVWHLTNE